MAKFPALPFWTDAYLADTIHLNTREHGAYLLLLITAWRTPDCDLPDNDKLLARYARMDMRGWRHMRPVLEQFFKVENGRWIQKRLHKERKYVEQHSRINSENSKARWLKNNDTTDATAMPTLCETDAPTPTPIEEEDTPSPVSTTEPLSSKPRPTHTLADAEKTAPSPTVVELKPNGKKYAWQGETFRLTVKDWRVWKRRYWAIGDLQCMLERADEYYVHNPDKQKTNMMFAYSNWLNNEHEKLVKRGAVLPQWLRLERQNAE